MNTSCDTVQPLHTYVLNDEERYALIDIVRFGDTSAIMPSLREKLLLSLANAAVLSMYGEQHQLTPEDLDGALALDAGDYPLAVQFLPMRPLSENIGG